jgi:hypothetical protein
MMNPGAVWLKPYPDTSPDRANLDRTLPQDGPPEGPTLRS